MQINKIWGIDLTDRQMKYQPWPINNDGVYRYPEKKAIEEIYSISGEAVCETLLYFEECDGDTDKLIELLNQHVIDNKFNICRKDLLDKSRWYTNEYYFYFIMFSKKVIGRYGFHYGENGNEPLSVYHKIYEQGFVKYPPWGKDDDGNDIHEISSLDIYFCFLILEKFYKIDSEDLIFLLNSVLPEKYQINRIFFENESIWCSVEIIDYCFEFLKIFSNDENSLVDKLYYVSINDLKTPRSLLSINKKLFLKNLPEIFKKINDIAYVYGFYKNKKFNVIGYVKEGVFNVKYRKYYKASLFNASKAFIAFIKTIFHIVFNKKDIKGFDVKIDYNINKPGIFIFKQLDLYKDYSIYFLSSLIIFLSMAISYYFSFVKNCIFNFYLLNIFFSFLGIFFTITLKKKNELNKKVETNYNASQEQISLLEKTTEELINERNSLEEKVQQRTKDLSDANEKLKELDKAKTSFFANISHELRTPLTLIIGPVKSIISGGLGEKIDRKNNIFTTISNNANRLLKLINGLLDFSKIEANRMNIKKQKTNVVNLLKHYISSISSAADNKEIELIFNDKSHGLITFIDRDLFETAVFNILSNAFKFTPPGGKINIELNKENDKFIVSVSDTGIGIPEDKIDKIFERFVQVDESVSRNYEGTGIGLSLTKEIVKIHGGEINVVSKLGEGSTFTIKLPIVYPEDDNNENAFDEIKPELLIDFKDIDKNENVVGYDNNKKNIFIVEDNADMLIFLRSILSDNYNIFTALNGKRALDKIFEVPDQDLIISDIMMPEMDGKTLFQELKKLNDYKNIPFIFLTARADVGEKIDGLKDGAVDYICKPFSKDELVAKVNSLLSSYESLKDSLKEKLINAIYYKEEEKNKNNFNISKLLNKMKISSREVDIISLLANGYEYKEIGNMLKISTNTVSNHIQNIYKKFNVNNKIDLINEIKVISE